MIDLDFGTYPYVTSSNPSIGSALTGLGVAPHRVHTVTAIVKAYCTRVGEGPFPTELSGPLEIQLRQAGNEYGTTTGRPRRCGWIDIPQLRYVLDINGANEINLTKLDILSEFPEIMIGAKYLYEGKEIDYMPASLNVYSKITVEYEKMPGWNSDISKCRRFEDLPINCQNYVKRLEELIGMKIRWIGVGAGRENVIDRGSQN